MWETVGIVRANHVILVRTTDSGGCLAIGFIGAID